VKPGFERLGFVGSLIFLSEGNRHRNPRCGLTIEFCLNPNFEIETADFADFAEDKPVSFMAGFGL
jgi:hypothetical protein